MSPSRNRIVLLAKKSGITSFSSLWQIKDALETKKVGHTGTLDTFAEGLLVALSGSLTRLCPLITNSDKEYLARIVFGSETDTLDPDGSIVKSGNLPLLSDLQETLPKFTGQIMQQPPVYSALRVAGKRASDLMRQGEQVVLEKRPVTVYSISLDKAFSSNGSAADNGSTTEKKDRISSAILSIRCSKGTYIRSLARDIAHSMNTCGYVGALRRTRIGPFTLDQAAGADELPPFSSSAPGLFNTGSRPAKLDPACIRTHSFEFTPELASVFGCDSIQLDPRYSQSFFSGKDMRTEWFTSFSALYPENPVKMVFCGTVFAGSIQKLENSYRYEFVAGSLQCM
ncbi:MAG TPA: tRNA pseudouridine(55) synthase TruB [Treponemataceae bacterium]|nr:tRNA pseudouridine(55) synthase TruB [Treponemataceae bacterium]